MAVTDRTPNDIIEGAFKLLGIYSSDRNLAGKKVTEGLYYLNALLNHYSSAPSLIAYNNEITFPLVVNQRDYVISDQVASDVSNRRLADLKYVNILDGDQRYTVNVNDDTLLYNFNSDIQSSSRPTNCFLQNNVGKSTITFIELPDKAYTCIVKGKFILDLLELNSVITQVPIAYHLFLEYALGRLLKARYPGATWTQEAEVTFQETKENLMGSNDLDLSLKPDRVFTSSGRYGTRRRTDIGVN